MRFMNLLRFQSHIFAGGTGGDNGSLSSILTAATELVTWVITSIGSFLSFILQNPVILVLFLMMLVSFAVGILFRIWRSTGV